MKPEVTKKRLLKLAEFLEALPRKRFNYGHWVGDDWKGKPDLSCGTTACALGWACSMPEFRRLGARLRVTDDFGYKEVEPCMANDPSSHVDTVWTRIFGLTDNEGDHLFCGGPLYDDHDGHVVLDNPYEDKMSKATPKQVGKLIRTFVKKVVDPKIAA